MQAALEISGRRQVRRSILVEPKGCQRPRRSRCNSTSVEQLHSYADIIGHYLRNYMPQVSTDAAFFGEQSQTPEGAVERAFLSRRADRRLHEHQYRIGYQPMAAAAAAMTPHAGVLVATTNFAELYGRVAEVRERVARIGDLAIYDIAQRLGWYLGIEPSVIYLHRGTREGATALVPQVRGRTMSADLLPVELRVLRPAQLEDVLCIYKAALRRIAART